MSSSEDKLETGRDITSALDAVLQAAHTMLAPLSRQMSPEEITQARKDLEMAEARITKLKVRFPSRR